MLSWYRAVGKIHSAKILLGDPWLVVSVESTLKSGVLMFGITGCTRSKFCRLSKIMKIIYVS